MEAGIRGIPANIADPVVGFVFGEEGLMADATIEGSKYTKLDL